MSFPTTFQSRIEDVDITGARDKSKLIQVTFPLKGKIPSIPSTTALLQNYPNPFNPDTWIPYQLTKDSEVVVEVYDLKGRKVRAFELGKKKAGYYLSKEDALHWDGKDELGQEVPSGLYFYTLMAGDFKGTRGMLVIK